MGIATNRQFAVITGASSGIGLELARECIENNFDILVCSEDPAGLAAAHQYLAATGAYVEAVRADLSTFAGCEKLVRVVEASHRNLDALLLNAGIGVCGEFAETDLDEELRSIGLNVNAVVHLCKRLVPRMVARGQGRILITGSVLSDSPAPYMAVYGATKAFELSFGQALRHELHDTGVTVTVLQPGATETEFFARAEMGDTKIVERDKDDPAQVAHLGFQAMMDGKDTVVAANVKSKLEGFIAKVLPASLKARLQASEVKPGSGKHSA